MDPLKAADRESQAQASRVMEWARDLYEENPDWVQFHAAGWGPGGALEGVFPERDRRQAFMVAQQGRELQGLLAALRRRQDRKARSVPTVTVTVRVPKPTHEFLVQEALDHNLSLHRLCLAKLSQPLLDEVVSG